MYKMIFNDIYCDLLTSTDSYKKCGNNFLPIGNLLSFSPTGTQDASDSTTGQRNGAVCRSPNEVGIVGIRGNRWKWQKETALRREPFPVQCSRHPAGMIFQFASVLRHFDEFIFAFVPVKELLSAGRAPWLNRTVALPFPFVVGSAAYSGFKFTSAVGAFELMHCIVKHGT